MKRFIVPFRSLQGLSEFQETLRGRLYSKRFFYEINLLPGSTSPAVNSYFHAKI